MRTCENCQHPTHKAGMQYVTIGECDNCPLCDVIVDARQKPLIERLGPATEEAEQAFWSAIVKHFPDARAGDVDPGWVAEREASNKQFVRLWLDWNAPGLAQQIGELPK